VLLFFTATTIFEFDYTLKEGEQERTIYTLQNCLMDPPLFGIFSKCQRKAIVTSINDVLFIDLDTGFELDIDAKENMSNILNIVSDDDYFYVISNKKHDVIGYYLFMMDIHNPTAEYEYLINWTNKTNIKSVDLQFLEDTDESGKMTKRLAVSYKAEGINTYNVFVFDIETKFVKFWFEAYQLYESPIKGLLLSTKDFMMLNKDGIFIINLGCDKARPVKD
jgi:hypothetical protein